LLSTLLTLVRIKYAQAALKYRVFHELSSFYGRNQCEWLATGSSAYKDGKNAIDIRNQGLDLA
jgi:hypothetical protein